MLKGEGILSEQSNIEQSFSGTHNKELDTYRGKIASLEEILDEARRGNAFIIVDESEKENEADLVVPATSITATQFNFMIKHCRGLPCLAVASSIQRRLELEPLPRRNADSGVPAFLTPIDAKAGITSGTSAEDRALTIRSASSSCSSASDFITPGHVMMIVAAEGGLSKRLGHTEASVALMAHGGLAPAAVLCEIIADDGKMAIGKQIEDFALQHNLKVITMLQIISYFKENPSNLY